MPQVLSVVLSKTTFDNDFPAILIFLSAALEMSWYAPAFSDMVLLASRTVILLEPVGVWACSGMKSMPIWQCNFPRASIKPRQVIQQWFYHVLLGVKFLMEYSHRLWCSHGENHFYVILEPFGGVCGHESFSNDESIHQESFLQSSLLQGCCIFQFFFFFFFCIPLCLLQPPLHWELGLWNFLAPGAAPSAAPGTCQKPLVALPPYKGSSYHPQQLFPGSRELVDKLCRWFSCSIQYQLCKNKPQNPIHCWSWSFH